MALTSKTKRKNENKKSKQTLVNQNSSEAMKTPAEYEIEKFFQAQT